MQDTNALEAAATPEVAVQEPSESNTEVKENVEQGEQAAPEAEEKVELTAEQWEDRYKNTEKMFEKRLSRKAAATRALQEKVNQLTEQVNAKPTVKEAKVYDNVPDIMDFDSAEDHAKAVSEYISQKVESATAEGISKHQQTLEQEAANRKQQETMRQFSQKENEMRLIHDDYDDVTDEFTEALGDLARSGVNTNTFGQAILGFENSAALAYEIAKSGQIEKFVSLGQMDLMRELVRLDSTLKPAEKADKKAPKPIKPIQQKGSKSISEKSAKDVLDWVKN